MATLLFRLRGVPDDEAQEVRDLLRAEGMDFYETPAGRWGISLAAIWLRDPAQVERAKQLLEAYQHDRGVRVRSEYAEQRERGEVETVVDRMRRRPLEFLLAIAAILVILYFMTWPFLRL